MLFVFIYYVFCPWYIGKSEENETGNDEGLTSGGKSTKVPVAGQNKRTGRRACTPRFQLYRTQQEQLEGQLEKHTTIKHAWSLECTVVNIWTSSTMSR